MPQVQRIDPIVMYTGKESVAAYCRVSSKSKDQLDSYHSQIAYYTKLINDNPEWELYDLYADEGITGTSTEKRDEFNRMMDDCREGKIQRILVKSISRFARNAEDLLRATRELKDLGVTVVFEEQGFDTSQVMEEMLLTMHAMAAQEESLSISKNMRWSYQKRMANGSFITTHVPLGYDMVDRELVENADSIIVKKIFELYNSGMGMEAIARYLNELHGEKRTWRRTSISKILRNEKYVGDSLFQKTYTTESLPFVERVNRGEKPQYFITNTHNGIIEHEEFNQARELMQVRGKRNRPHEDHLFTHRLQCPVCKKHFRAVVAAGKTYWICASASKGERHSVRLSEMEIEAASINMMARLYLHCDHIIVPTVCYLREIEYAQTEGDSKLFELDQAISAINDKNLTLQKLNTKGFISADEFRIQNEKLSAERKKLTAQRNKKLHGLRSHSAIEKLEELQAILSSWPGIPTKFDIDQFDEIVEKIIPTDDNKLIFRLHCGMELTEEISS